MLDKLYDMGILGERQTHSVAVSNGCFADANAQIPARSHPISRPRSPSPHSLAEGWLSSLPA